jgi:hypothetical protein
VSNSFSSVLDTLSRSTWSKRNKKKITTDERDTDIRSAAYLHWPFFVPEPVKGEDEENRCETRNGTTTYNAYAPIDLEDRRGTSTGQYDQQALDLNKHCRHFTALIVKEFAVVGVGVPRL